MTTALVAGPTFDITNAAAAGSLDIDLFDIAATSLEQPLEIAVSTSNLLTDAAVFAGSTVSVPVPAAGIAVGIYLAVLKRATTDNPTGTSFGFVLQNEQTAALNCPYHNTLTALQQLYTCASATTTAVPTGFDTVIGSFAAEAYTYTNDFDFASNPYHLATYNLGTLTSGNWVSVQFKLNNAVSTTDPGVDSLLLNIYSARADGANTDISTLCDGLGTTATECVFTYQITASIPSTHYLTVASAVDFSAQASSILQTFQIAVNSYATVADLNAGTSAIASHDNTDVLRNDVVRLIFIQEPIYYRVSLTGATATSVVYMWATAEGAASPIDDYMTATGTNMLTAVTGATGVYEAVLPPGQYILAVSSGTTQVNSLVLNSVSTTPGKSCHFNSAWEDDAGVFVGCVAATVTAPTLTAVVDVTQVDFTFGNSFASAANPYYQIRYDIGSRAVGNYILIKLLGSATTPNVNSMVVTLHKGLTDSTGISLGHKCTAADSCTFSYIVTETAQYYLLINEPTNFGTSFDLETLHIAVDAFESLTAFNAGSPSITNFPL